MTANVSTTLSLVCQVTKQNIVSDPSASNPTILMDLKIPAQSWSSSSSPINSTQAWSGHIALVSGAATIDLTNLTQLSFSGTIDTTGLKLRSIAVLADSGNANVISIGTGASNGYPSIGVISQIANGDPVIRICNNSVAVDGTHKTLDLAGTGTQGCSIILTFGA